MLSDVTGEHTGGLPSTTWPLLIGSTSKTATPLAPAETTSLVLLVLSCIDMNPPEPTGRATSCTRVIALPSALTESTCSLGARPSASGNGAP